MQVVVETQLGFTGEDALHTPCRYCCAPHAAVVVQFAQTVSDDGVDATPTYCPAAQVCVTLQG